MTQFSTPTIVAGAAAAILSILVLGLPVTLLLAIVAVAAYLYMRRHRGQAAGAPRVGVTAATSGTPLTPTVSPSSPLMPPAPSAAGPSASATDGVRLGAAAVIEAIRSDCIAQGFFTKHTVKSERIGRGGGTRVVMSAVSRTNGAFLVDVTATETAYGTRLDCVWREKGQSLVAAVGSNALGSAVKSGLQAGRASALRKQLPELELELHAFRRQILDRYLAD